jgi:ribosomal protein S27E
MAKVTKYTRAGKTGKNISCPNCEHRIRAFHFSWSALQCQKCKKLIEKEKWNISENQNYNA